ncbi:MAG: barstar family protein [Planctomycetaceae bacterium]
MKIILLGEEIGSAIDLHRVLAEKLDFGPYYGNNLAALWDRLTTDVEGPVHLVWKDSSVSKAKMGEQLFDKVVKLFRDVEAHDKELGRSDVFTLSLE